jgi:hypothetical protein
MLSRAEQESFISGVPVSANGFRLSHLFFTDDSLLFCRANFQEWGNMMKLLQNYEQASGKKLNSTKIAIYFSKNTGIEFQGSWSLQFCSFGQAGMHLLQFPESLMAIVLKEKYFRGCSFLQTRMGYNSSYAWHSIVNARAVLERGLFWRVGNGDSIRIWGDKWVALPTLF